jgi:hypothetical protein
VPFGGVGRDLDHPAFRGAPLREDLARRVHGRRSLGRTGDWLEHGEESTVLDRRDPELHADARAIKPPHRGLTAKIG